MSSPATSTPNLKWAARAGIALAALVILYTGAAFGLSRFLDPEGLASWLEPRLEQALNRDVEVARVEVGFFPLGIGLRELTLSDPTGMAPTLARVASVDFQVRILPLLKREVWVHRLTVDGLEADLRVSSDGRSNFGDLSTRTEADAGRTADRSEADKVEGSKRPFTLNLKSARFTNSGVRFSRQSDTLVGEIGKLKLRVGLRKEADGSWLVAGSSDSELNLRRGGSNPLFEDTPIGLTFDVQTDGEFNSVRIRTGELVLGQIALDVTGDLEGLQDPVRSVSLALVGQGLPLGDILAALPASTRSELPVGAEGVLAVDLRITGEVGPGQLPEIRGDVGLTRGRLTFEG
ncbi:MAG: AsmA family protein, partial [Longimicrobiales bacterium]|nr:AsmA family protein [Longimicrobiales bacterium]